MSQRNTRINRNNNGDIHNFYRVTNNLLTSTRNDSKKSKFISSRSDLLIKSPAIKNQYKCI